MSRIITPLINYCIDQLDSDVRTSNEQVGDTLESWERQLHQLAEGVDIPVTSLDDERSLHPCHRFGAGHLPALSHPRRAEAWVPIPKAVAPS